MRYGEREVLGKRHVVCRLAEGALFPVPDWMVDETICAAHSLGEPMVSVAALRELQRVLCVLGPAAMCDSQGIPFTEEESDGSKASSSHAATPSALGGADASASRVDTQRGHLRRGGAPLSSRSGSTLHNEATPSLPAQEREHAPEAT